MNAPKFDHIPVTPTKKNKRGIDDTADIYTTSPYSSSLPSPPYSEESYSSTDENDLADADSYSKNPTTGFTTEHKIRSNFRHDSSKSSPQNKHPITLNEKLAPKLAKVYPNLMKGVLGKTNSKSSKRLKNGQRGPYKKKEKNALGLSLSPRKENVVTCQVCSKLVSAANLKDHLYFGPVICRGCDWEEEFCPNFSSFHKTSTLGKIGCPHSSLKWKRNTIDFLRQKFQSTTQAESHDTFLSNLSNYLEALRPLKTSRPWNKAFKTCADYIKSYNIPQMHSSTSTTPSDVIKSPKKRGRKPNRKETIHLADDEFYLILKESIEECPNCYQELNPSRLQFNIALMLINTICSGCSLKIFFVFPPPDGSDPKVQIIHEA